MAHEDDLEVMLKVKLDEKSIAEEVRKAEAAVEGRAGGKAPPTSPPSASTFKDIGKSIADSFKDQQGKMAGGKILSGFGEAALPLAAGLLAVGLLKEMANAIKSVVTNLLALGAALSRVNPELAVAFRYFSVEMRKLAIDLGRTLGPAIADLVRSLADLIRTIVTALKPALVVMAGIIHAAAAVIRFITSLIADAVRAVGMFVYAIGRAVEWIADMMSYLNPAFVPLKLAAAALAKAAEEWTKAVGDKSRPQDLLNMLLIRGLSVAAAQPSRVVTAASEGRTPPGVGHGVHPGREPSTPRVGPPRASMAHGRTAVPMPAPKLASVTFSPRADVKLNIENEKQLSRALDDVRRTLTDAVMRVRNDQLMLANRLANATVVDLVT